MAVRVEFERSGGVAGVVLRAAVDTEELPVEEAEALMALLGGSGLPRLARGVRAADQFQYRLEVVRGGRRSRYAFAESQVTPELRPLLERLTELATRR